METYYFKTEHSHANNTVTMSEFLEYHLESNFMIDFQDGSYAVIQDELNGKRYGVSASGNGDFHNHKIEFNLLNAE